MVQILYITTTEPLEHMFGTTGSWKRELNINGFIIFSGNLEIMMETTIENDIKTGLSSKGYTAGFTGFSEVVNKMKKKFKNEMFVCNEVLVVVDVD